MLQDLADPDWILDPLLAPACRRWSAHDLVFDALVHPSTCRASVNWLAAIRGCAFVIDHAGKPRHREWTLATWAHELRRIGVETAASCKLSAC